MMIIADQVKFVGGSLNGMTMRVIGLYFYHKGGNFYMRKDGVFVVADYQ